jgi:hypothetical protein
MMIVVLVWFKLESEKSEYYKKNNPWDCSKNNKKTRLSRGLIYGGEMLFCCGDEIL